MIFHEDQWEMVLLMEQNVSLPNKRKNLFQLLCIAHTTNGSCVIKRSLKYSDAKWKQYIEFLKQYLCMKEWFHDSNSKVEVINARPLIAKILWSLQRFFPRNTNTNGYNVPKMHGITKMQEYMKLFGSGINFMVDLENQHTSNLLKYQYREHSAE